jgi:putative ABC transport system substrate-binding protein
MGTDPVEIGLVTSLNRPGGNVTGIALLNVGLVAKRLELLHQLVPTVTPITYLRNPTNTKLAEAETKEAQAAAQRIGIDLAILDATNIAEIEEVTSAAAHPIRALLISADPLFFTAIDQLVQLTARRAIPAMAHWREFTTAGGLINYGPSFPKAYRGAGILTGRILRGEKPDSLPVQQATKIEFVINLATAKSLGLTIPANLHAFADEIIE